MTIAHTLQRPLAPADDPRQQVIPAGVRGALAVLVDVLVAMVPLLVVPLLAATRLAGGWAWTIAVLLVLGAAWLLLVDVTHTGRSPGRRWLGVRTVSSDTLLPPAVGELARRRVIDADLRTGRDPLRLMPRGTRPLRPATWDGWQQPAPVGTGSWLLVLDNGEQLPIDTSTLVGRNPTNEPDQNHALVSVPDLSRSISRVHALLETDADCVWLTDTGATNGTRAASPSPSGGTVIERWLRRGERVAVRAGGIIHLGDRELRVTRSNHPGA